MAKVYIEAERNAYSVEDIYKTMTVGELVHYLQDNFDDDDEIYLSHDNGYTFGAITEDRIG
jgi:hypothetical protein